MDIGKISANPGRSAGQDTSVNNIVDKYGTEPPGGIGIETPSYVSLATALSKDIDSIDLAKMSKGGVTIIHDAITANVTTAGAQVDCRGYNAILMSLNISSTKSCTFAVQGCLGTDAMFYPVYEQANTGRMVAMSVTTNANGIYLFKGVPDYIKVYATEIEDGAIVTVKVQPLNV